MLTRDEALLALLDRRGLEVEVNVEVAVGDTTVLGGFCETREAASHAGS